MKIMNNLIDLTHTIKDCLPVFPGDDEIRLWQTQYLDTDGYNNHNLKIGMHGGTHIDAPMHMIQSNEYISQFPLETFIGNGCVLDVRNQSSIKPIKKFEAQVKQGDIVLLYTGYADKFGTNEYFEDYPIVSDELAEFFVQKKIKMLGMDIPSPDKYPYNVHKLLLSNNILIIENLVNLDKLLSISTFEVIAFPLKINAEASIARVVAREY